MLMMTHKFYKFEPIEKIFTHPVRKVKYIITFKSNDDCLKHFFRNQYLWTFKSKIYVIKQNYKKSEKVTVVFEEQLS